VTDSGIPGLPPTLRWKGGAQGLLVLLDQTRLPTAVVFRECGSAEAVHAAIRELCVRGAPAIGVAAAYGLCLGTRSHSGSSAGEFIEQVRKTCAFLESARPTAVNLSWALRRVCRRGEAAISAEADPQRAWELMLAEAHRMAEEDAAVCRRIGEVGAPLIRDGMGVLTHCNAGALATVAHGTALSPMYEAHRQGRRFRVFVDETRPLLQGARLTAFELSAAGLDVTVLCDGAAATLMAAGRVQLVVVGADRIAANGDTANKVGTYGVAIAARHHGVPFYVAAPRSTFDLSIPDGAQIPIEERSADEVRCGFGRTTVAGGAACYNPAFDVTPAGMIRGIITESGLLEPVSVENIRQIVGCGSCNEG